MGPSETKVSMQVLHVHFHVPESGCWEMDGGEEAMKGIMSRTLLLFTPGTRGSSAIFGLRFNRKWGSFIN